MKRTLVETLRCTPNPQNLCAMALHNDYSEHYIGDEPAWLMKSEEEAGKIVVDRCLKQLHFGPLEHPQITLGFKGFPHSVMQQLRTHRVGFTMDCQSLRYTGKRFINWYNKHKHNPFSDESYSSFEDLFYVRPIGEYKDRFGHEIDFTEHLRKATLRKELTYFLEFTQEMLIKNNAPFEMFRDVIPAGYRQNFMISVNARSLCHILDMRLPKDAQLEINEAMEGALIEAKIWMPQIFKWYEQKRARKNKLAP